MSKVSIFNKIKEQITSRSHEKSLAKQSILMVKIAEDISKTAQSMVERNNNDKVIAEAMKLGKLASKLLRQSEELQKLIEESGEQLPS